MPKSATLGNAVLEQKKLGGKGKEDPALTINQKTS